MYKVQIEVDEQNRVPLSYKVAVRRLDKTVVGVPARGLTREDAIRLQDIIRYAFDYGLSAGRGQMEFFLYKVYDTESHNVTPEEGPHVHPIG